MGRSASDFADKREVYLKYLPASATDEQLRELFSKHGEITRIWHGRNKETGESKGFAFITFKRKDDARNVVRLCNQHPHNFLDGKHIEISHAKPWTEHTAKTHAGLKNLELTENGGVGKKKAQGHKHKLGAKARKRAKARATKEGASEEK